MIPCIKQSTAPFAKMDYVRRTQNLIETVGQVGDMLKTFNRTQLCATFYDKCVHAIFSEEGGYSTDFNAARPEMFGFYDINGVLHYHLHPVETYLSKLLCDKEIRQKPVERLYKKEMIKMIDDVFRGFSSLSDRNCAVSPQDPNTKFEVFLRKSAHALISEIVQIYSTNIARIMSVKSDRRALYNLRRRVKTAERRVAIETENLTRLRIEQQQSETYLANLVD